MLISPAYLDLNRDLHARGDYGLGGAKWAPAVDKIARLNNLETVLDYGCGQGTLSRLLRAVDTPYSVSEYDPAIEGKELRPLRTDMVVCCDVLEHVEPECLYAVLDDIHNIARVFVFLVVATREAGKTLADGRNAHLIIEKPDWWLPKLMYRWRIDAFKDMRGEFMFVGAPR